MDDELFDALYHIASRLWPQREKRVQFSGRLIVLMYLWSAIRRKPRGWVCNPANQPRLLQNTPMPSVSRFRRRLNEPRFQEMLAQIEAHCRGLPQDRLIGCWTVDAKPLPVSPYSKDKDAAWGWACNRKARGYKLFALCTLQGDIADWRLEAMNASEPVMARTLLEATDRPGYLIGDSIYDSGPLHEAAAARQVQLVAPRKEPGGNVGLRARQPTRLHAIDMLETFCNRFGPALYDQRSSIERIFSRLASSDVGLDSLPPFIRTPHRVRLWVQGKIILYALLKTNKLRQ